MKNVNSLSSLSDNSLSSRRATGTVRELDLESRMTFNYRLPKKSTENKINDFVVDIQEYKNYQKRLQNPNNNYNKNLNCFERNPNNASNDNLSMSNDLFSNESSRVNSLNTVNDLKKNILTANRRNSKLAALAASHTATDNTDQLHNDSKYSIDANVTKINTNRELASYYKNTPNNLTKSLKLEHLKLDSHANLSKSLTDDSKLFNMPLNKRKQTTNRLTFNDLDDCDEAADDADPIMLINNNNNLNTPNESSNLSKAISDTTTNNNNSSNNNSNNNNSLRIPEFNKSVSNTSQDLTTLDMSRKEADIKNENLLQIPNYIVPNSNHVYDESELLLGNTKAKLSTISSTHFILSL